MYNPIPNHAFLHSCYIDERRTPDGSDGIVACVKNMETGESKLHIVNNPKTQVYVLREALRTFEHQREYVRVSDCDMYVVPYRQQYDFIYSKLNPRSRNFETWKAKKDVQSSPYAFGWNISPQVRMKCEYLEATPKDPTNLKLAVLDIETCVLDENRDAIIALSICDWNARVVHCFIDTATWLRDLDEKVLASKTDKAYAEFVDGLNQKARKIWDEKPVVPKYYFCDGERDLLIKTFEILHQIKPDFLAVWNLGFDCPYILNRLQYRQIDVPNTVCLPDVPPKFRYVEWHEDKSKVDHFTDVWHVLDAPGYTYWYDAMALYARVRKVQGRDINYTLDYIGNKIIGSGKMHFGANQSHYLMQTNDKIGYCVYNTIDTLIPALMNAVTQDLSTMLALADCSLIQDFSRQTVQLTAQFYSYLIHQGKIPGACAGSIKQSIDNYIGNVGGAVLNPTLMSERGLPAVKESPNKTNIFKLASDLDVSSFYPSMTIAANVSRETKLFTTLWIEGCPYTLEQLENEQNPKLQSEMAKENAEYIYTIFGLLPCVKENAVALCHSQFGLPDYNEMLELIKQKQEVP